MAVSHNSLVNLTVAKKARFFAEMAYMKNETPFVSFFTDFTCGEIREEPQRVARMKRSGIRGK